MMHTHKNAHPHITLDSGGHYEVCECGASRKIKANGEPEGPAPATGWRNNAKTDRDGWHTCDLCTPRAS